MQEGVHPLPPGGDVLSGSGQHPPRVTVCSSPPHTRCQLLRQGLLLFAAWLPPMT